MTSEKMKLEKINIWAIILGLVIILQLFPAYRKKIPGLSRTLSVSKDFPGLDFFLTNSRLSRIFKDRGDPVLTQSENLLQYYCEL
jgi:hypothetical protein